MAKQYTSASGSDITPRQADMELSKSIMKKFEDCIDRNERNIRNAMEFQEKPVTVVTSDEIEAWIKDRSEEYEEYRQNLSDVHKDLDQVRRATCGYGELARQLKELLRQNAGLLAYLKQEVDAPAPEPEGFEKFEARLAEWWDSRKVFRWRFGLFISAVCAAVIVCLHVKYWSDDAWARRAYEAVLRDGREKPGEIYHWGREMFNAEGRRTAKAAIRALEQKEEELQ